MWSGQVIQKVRGLEGGNKRFKLYFRAVNVSFVIQIVHYLNFWVKKIDYNLLKAWTAKIIKYKSDWRKESEHVVRGGIKARLYQLF
jgi:hypothetical protein